jgi:hypothetical protein
MSRESTPDTVRSLAGSMITLLTNYPIASEITGIKCKIEIQCFILDVNSGSYGHVNIVMPRPSRVYANERYTI